MSLRSLLYHVFSEALRANNRNDKHNIPLWHFINDHIYN